MRRLRRRARRDPNLGPWVRVHSPAALEAALKLARGTRQRELLLGRETYSGSTAKERGIGSTFRNLYRKGHDRLLWRLKNAGVEWTLEDGGTRTVVRTPFQEKILNLHAFRDPKETIDRIVWFAKRANRSAEAKYVLHDLLLQASDVPLSANRRGIGSWDLARDRQLATLYAEQIRLFEAQARMAKQKLVILFNWKWLKRGQIANLFSMATPQTLVPTKEAVAVYTTRAGR